MSELSDRLRRIAEHNRSARHECDVKCTDDELDEAADELERLQREVERLRKARDLLYDNTVWWWMQRDEAAAERDRLQAIVDRLPKDADGNPILPNETVYWIGEDGFSQKWTPYIATDGRTWYRTRAAAEKARAAP
jgi:hypothetical protein